MAKENPLYLGMFTPLLFTIVGFGQVAGLRSKGLTKESTNESAIAVSNCGSPAPFVSCTPFICVVLLLDANSRLKLMENPSVVLHVVVL